MESLVSTRAGLTPFVAFHGSFALLTHATFSFARTRCAGSQSCIRKELTCFILYTFSSFLSILETFFVCSPPLSLNFSAFHGLDACMNDAVVIMAMQCRHTVSSRLNGHLSQYLAQRNVPLVELENSQASSYGNSGGAGKDCFRTKVPKQVMEALVHILGEAIYCTLQQLWLTKAIKKWP